jgi:hypothetical protein
MKDTNTQKTGKNGYEIRLEILGLAMGQADSAYFNELERLRHVYFGKKGTWELPKDNRVDEAMQIAEKLYKFVENK